MHLPKCYIFIELSQNGAAQMVGEHYEHQYLNLMRDVWHNGAVQGDRTGVGTKALFGATMRFSLADNAVPLLTTKRVFWKTAAREMLWFLTGNTNIRPLLLNKVRIWTDWPLQKYRQATGISISQDEFEERIVLDEAFAMQWGDLGPVYGKQWVDWPTYKDAGDGLFAREDTGINQVALLVDSLKKNPGSRRHIIEGWNVADLDKMALPPCHKTYQFQVADGKLNGLLFQRSCDLGLGFAFNVFSASLLIRMLAQQTGYEPGEFIWQGGDVHLYLNHAPLIEEQLSRVPAGAPKLRLVGKPSSIFDYKLENFAVENYEPQSHISAPVAV
jgi:thymidylate synthase